MNEHDALALGVYRREEVMMVAICTHLDQIRVGAPEHVGGCEECLKVGGQWMHIRVCRSCGQVACCDSSPNQHASKHVAGDRSSDLQLA